jgi:triphosphoribosyl-dephospho-CoA synthase
LTTGFEGTRYEHFLASAVATTPWFKLAAEHGIAVSREEIKVSDVRVGQIIRNCVLDINSWQYGGNTLLGTVILVSPIAVAAGMTNAMKENILEIHQLRQNLKRVIESTKSEDAVDVYEAIRIAKPSGLGKAPELDVNDSNSVNRIVKESITLYQVFKIASPYDRVCSEWINNYPLTFQVAYPYLMEQISDSKDLNKAIIHTFLKVLGEYPDTFIARKIGIEKAKEVSVKASKILELGGLETSPGRKSLHEFDLELRRSSNDLNPGTTADIVAAALALCILNGYRP